MRFTLFVPRSLGECEDDASGKRNEWQQPIKGRFWKNHSIKKGKQKTKNICLEAGAKITGALTTHR